MQVEDRATEPNENRSNTADQGIEARNKYSQSQISSPECSDDGTPNDIEEFSMKDIQNQFATHSFESAFREKPQGYEVAGQSPWESLDDPDSEATIEAQSSLSTQPAITEVAMESVTCKKIHILGSGAVGKFLAHHMAELPFSPSITLLLHRPFLLQTWQDEGAAIRLMSPDGEIKVSTALNVESSMALDENLRPHQTFNFGTDSEVPVLSSSGMIDSLLVTTEQRRMIPALRSVKHRLRPESTVCIMADGLGVVEQINADVFPDPRSRPHYIMGNISHVLQPMDMQFSVIQRRAGTIRLSMPVYQSRGSITGVTPRDGENLVRRMHSPHDWPDSARLLLLTLCRQPQLRAISLPQSEWLRTQLERLLINSILGPITVLFDCSNDQLLYNYHANRIMIKVMEEICKVVQNFPELNAKAKQRFSIVNMQHQVLSVISRTGRSYTTMLRDIRAGERTDVDYFNGYILKRAKELGIYCPVNEMLVSMVKAKAVMKSQEKNAHIPFSLRQGR